MKPLVNKKPLLSILVATALMVGGVQFAYSHGHGGYGQDDFQHQNPDCQQHKQMMDKTDTKINTEALQKFLDATTALRKSYTQKRAEMKANMHSETPDVASAGKIAGELFDIREKLIKQAKANDLKVAVALRLAGGGNMMGGKTMGDRSQCRQHQINDGDFGPRGRADCPLHNR